MQCPPLAGVARSAGGGCIVSKHKGEGKKQPVTMADEKSNFGNNCR
ncbi:MAG: hypothetical protein WAW31_09200 [Smithella sp.]